MGQSRTEPVPIKKAAENLAVYAIDREDLKALIKDLPKNTDLNMTTLEYELQILRILSVGWGLAFFMSEGDLKQNMTTLFWQRINEIAKSISTLTQTTTGSTLDYFLILKNHMDTYLASMEQSTGSVSDPATVIGPAFAKVCGAPDNAVAILAGTKMFTRCLGGVKEYLAIVTIES
ncbi:MAG: hypothetical protein V1793_00765 [Pseudomonadota bacterium]